MTEDLKNKIARAKELLFTSRHIALATVNEDGSPHNTPLRLLYDSKLEHIYFASKPDSLHTQNALRTGQIFAVIFDRVEKGGTGLYLRCAGAEELAGPQEEEGLRIHNSFRAREGSEPLPSSFYDGDSQMKMYRAKIKQFWINYMEKDASGRIIRDGRWEIAAQDLLE